MWNSKKSVDFSIGVCFFVTALLVVLIFAGPKLFHLYMTAYRGIAPDGAAMNMLAKVFAAVFYPSSVFAAIILYSLIKLLKNIREDEVFIIDNVKYLKKVSWCCVIIGVIAFVGGIFYLPCVLISCAGFFVGMLLRVLKNVMQKAVEIKEENDLTV